MPRTDSVLLGVIERDLSSVGSPSCMNYQMFRHAKNPSRCCAIRDGESFPQVLGPNEWAEAEYLDEREPRPPGFDEAAAQYACAVQGFYLFTWSGRRNKPSPPP